MQGFRGVTVVVPGSDVLLGGLGLFGFGCCGCEVAVQVIDCSSLSSTFSRLSNFSIVKTGGLLVPDVCSIIEAPVISLTVHSTVNGQ